jgi:hypothetical protein
MQREHSCVSLCAISLWLAACAGAVDSSDADAEGDKVRLGVSEQAILGGTEGGSVGAVEIFGAPGGCSGALVGRHMILTAAHCFPDLDNSLSGFVPRVINYATTGTTWRCMTNSAPANAKCDAYRNVFVYRMGLGAYEVPETDFAIVFTEARGGVWQNVSSSDASAGLYSGSLSVGTSFQFYGRGHNHWSGTGDGIMRFMLGSLDWVGPSHFVHDAPNTPRICKGDSGGPYFLSISGGTWIFGAHHGAQLSSECAKVGGKTNATRINAAKIDFINQKRANETLGACRPTSTNANYWRCS